jgi:S1-C subfamily serine protease
MNSSDPVTPTVAGGLRVRGHGPSVSVLLATVFLCGVLAAVLWRNLAGAPTSAELRAVDPRGSLQPEETATIELFERCSKSVVYVSPLVRRLRATPFGFESDIVEAGTGSGFVWDDDGHIVTNYHVVQGAQGCSVTLPDHTTYQSERVGEWAWKDIAVLRIRAPREKLHPISVGASSDLRVGQKVLAIGNPFGLDFTLTTGVVSALNREIPTFGNRTIQGVIQTDAAINPGNSGGPLLDSAGRLIGMNTAIFSRTGSSAGIGFSVPVDTINRVVPQLIEHRRVIRPGLGIIPDDSIPRQLGIPGVLVLSVSEDSVAAAAGLRPTMLARDGRVLFGDFILKVDDTPTPTKDGLYNALERYDVGQQVTLTVRDTEGATRAVTVTLQALD